VKLIDNIESELYLGVSKIPNAGIGLFTNQVIPTGIPVCEYKGDIFLDNEIGMVPLNQRYDYTLTNGARTRHMEYAGTWRSPNEEQYQIDAHPMFCKGEIGLGGFANDALNWEQRQGRPKEDEGLNLEWRRRVGYNCYYWNVPKEKKSFLISFCRIEAGSEILVDYGDEYWECVGKIRPQEMKKKK
tara:strand:- start:11 stop:568 length:558 start_codon:yes stop_codon:yes gene_type:complete